MSFRAFLIHRAASACIGVVLSLHMLSYAGPVDSAKQASTTVAIQVRSGHIHLEAMINGAGPFHLLFDTGAPNVLTPAAAKRLTLEVENNLEATGTGGKQAGGSTRVRTVDIGNVQLVEQTFYVLDLPTGFSEDVPVDGLIGSEWLERYPARLDYFNSQLTFYTGDDARYDGSAKPSQLYFRGKTPQINGKVDGIEGRFSLDTGSPGSLTLSAPFVEQHDLVKRYAANKLVMAARGIGGPVYAYLARVGLLDLDTATALRPVTFLSQQTTGTSTRKDTAGNVGYGVLHQFSLFFDYRKKQIYFEPNADWGQVDLADRSGLRLERDGDMLSVVFVAKGSPGESAGLKKGDRIVSVNGTVSSALLLGDVRMLLKGPIGSQIRIITSGDVNRVLILSDL